MSTNWLGVAIAIVGMACGNKSANHDEPAPHGSAAIPPTPVATGSATATTAAATTKQPPPLTAQQRADYRKDIKAGWAAQKAAKWPDAVTAFEAALVAVPFDQRAEGELGLSAMQAGDLDKAKRADELAVSQAVDHKAEAMARFNLGALLEKTNDAAGALKQYEMSIALRPNTTVQAAADRLAGGGSGSDTTIAKVFCTPGESPCDCAIDDAFGHMNSDDMKPICQEATSPIPDWHVYHLADDGLEYDYLFDNTNHYVAVIGDDNMRGRHSEHTSLVSAEIKPIGGHRVLWLSTSSTELEQSASNENDDEFLNHTEDVETLTLCVLGTPTTCPLSVPTDHEVSEDVFHGESAPKPLHPPLSSKAKVAVSDDGVATVTAVGKPDDDLKPLVGPHKLW